MVDTRVKTTPVCFRVEHPPVTVSSQETQLLRGLASMRAEKISAAERQGLHEVLQLLACGEESAIHVFHSECTRTSTLERLKASSLLLKTVADEEAVHDLMVKRILAELETETDNRPNPAVRRFLMRLASKDPAQHFLRVAELDAAVCIMIGEVLHGPGLLGRADCLRKIMSRIQSDEARHVVISRAHIRALGMRTRDYLDDAEWVRSTLCGLIEASGASFEASGADTDRIRKRIMSRGLRQVRGNGKELM